MLKDFWGSVLLFQVGVFRQLMNEAFSVWDSKYLTGKFRKICASEFSRPLQGKKKKKRNLKKNHLFCRKETRKHRKEEREWETQELRRAVLLCSVLWSSIIFFAACAANPVASASATHCRAFLFPCSYYSTSHKIPLVT